MNNLTRVIGPAPSEIPLVEFISGRLLTEHDRVRDELARYREAVKPKTKKITKTEKGVFMKKFGKTEAEVNFILEQQRVELELLQKEIEEMEKGGG